VKKLEADGGFLARRLSGGGAVYHDLGNLNFTFITTRGDYDEYAQTETIIKAVNEFGIDAERSGRNDLISGGRKFSGNAFYHGINSLRHGTILADSDITKLGLYLNAPGGKLETKGIKSVASRVVNLVELNPAITIEKLKDALRRAVSEVFDAPVFEIDESEIDKVFLEASKIKFSGAEWKYGNAPNGDYRLCERFPWGEAEIIFKLADGFVAECSVYSDALETTPFELLRGALTGLRFDREELSETVSAALMDYAEIREDVYNLLK